MAAVLPRRTSFSGTGLLHTRSQSLLDVRAHRNSIAGDPRVGQMMERRQRGLSKLRGLVIPEKVPEMPVLLPDLPEIKSVPPSAVTTRNSWSPLPAMNPTSRVINWNQYDASPVIPQPPASRPASWQPESASSSSWSRANGTKPLNAPAPTTTLRSSWNQSTMAPRESSRPSWSTAASVPKYSPAFKRKSLSLSSSVSSSLSSSREELRPLFENRSDSQPPPLPPSRPPPILPPTEPKSLESIASSPTRSDISFEFRAGVAKSPAATPETDVLTPHSKGGGGDESDDSAVSSSRSSQYSPPASPLNRPLSSSTDHSTYKGRLLKPRSVEAINRKNVLSSARHSSGRDLKAGSPLIQRKMPLDTKDNSSREPNGIEGLQTSVGDEIQSPEDKLEQYNQDMGYLRGKSGTAGLLTKKEDSNSIISQKADDGSIVVHTNVNKQDSIGNKTDISNSSAPATQYKTEERVFRVSYPNLDQKNGALHQKVDDRIAMMHQRTGDIRRSMEIVTTVGQSKSDDNGQGVKQNTSEDHPVSAEMDNDSTSAVQQADDSEARNHSSTGDKNTRVPVTRNRSESVESTRHQFASMRSKFEENLIYGSGVPQPKHEDNKIFAAQRKSDENSAVLKRQDAVDDTMLEMNGNNINLDGKSRPVAAPRRYTAQWEAPTVNKLSPIGSPVSPVPPSVPPKPASKVPNGSSGSISRQDSGPMLVKHVRGSSLDSTASDDNTLRDSVLYGSVSSLSSASSIITPQELQQLMNEANQSLDESGVSSPVMLEVVVLHRDIAGGGVGITLAGGADYEAKEITVHKVLAGSTAERDGRLQKGDRILSINGHSMKGITHRESLRILKSPTSEVVLVVMKRGPEGMSSPTFEEPAYGRKAAPFRVLEQLKENATEAAIISSELLDGGERGPPMNLVLCKDGAGLGFSLDGGRDSPLGDRPLTVKKIFTGGAAEKQGQLKAGDELLSVAGSDVTSMTRIEAWTLMKKLPSGPVTISIRPKAAV